jgi:hypothetical protein
VAEKLRGKDTKTTTAMIIQDKENAAANAMVALTVANTSAVAERQIVAKEDLELLAQWVRTDLFDRVKFLYNPEKDLRVGGALYQAFVRDCRERLVGLKGPQASAQEYSSMYLELLWREANKKKKNVVANGLTSKRSSVYSAMQNRFIGKSGWQ